MLVVSRKIHDENEIGGEPIDGTNEVVAVASNGERIVFKLLNKGHSPGRIRVGIDAPKSVTLLRGELERAA